MTSSGLDLRGSAGKPGSAAARGGSGSGFRTACGIVSAGLAVGAAELVAVPVGSGSAPMTALGGTVVDHTPDKVREWVIGIVGTNDKLVLFILMTAVAVVVAGFAGRIEQQRRPLGSVLLGVFGVVAAYVAVNRPAAPWTWALPSLIGVALAIVVLRWLIRRVDAYESAAVPPAGQATGPATGLEEAAGPDTDADRPETGTGATASGRRDDMARRGVLFGIVGVGVVAAAAETAGRIIGSALHSVSAERATVQLPAPPTPLPAVDPAADLRIPGLTPYLTANHDFYRIDTALIVPQVSAETWSLRVHGMVDREIRLNYADLKARKPIERLVTLTCVSNPVGGDLIGNALWLGYPLADLLAEAGPHADADMVLSRSVDGFTAGSPLATVTDGRDAMLAIGMNGVPLPIEHGYPVRLVVPGLYGYVSATKWVTDIEITRFDRARAYWTERGWSERGPIKTGTRIDTPHDGANPKPGTVTVAGVAWAQHRGIKAVEVQIDDGPWQPARLAADPSIDTWRQWAYDWNTTPGSHTIRARSTDATGQVQTSEQQDVVPDGATGYPSISVRVG
ncbi:molybdopterin-dependent oxidoreductase [Nocardia sp. NEAU-G5]|uniref:Molybdopterin-dependent oxidoreductase n=1 Tax=Nocardia albiluteola TaxID=2842303 RepID=A0ABS6AZ99_9NOCA|nr:molybdopterin-dependent oxidoreductase [Nocardia albiluteola]MBU3063372.1 molybdopterin-dependent oxidoreductase [Nocardia albiluteola]